MWEPLELTLRWRSKEFILGAGFCHPATSASILRQPRDGGGIFGGISRKLKRDAPSVLKIEGK
jgi:hypothetical protein